MCVWTLAFFGDFKQNSSPDFIMIVGKKDTRFQPYHFRRGSFSGNSDFYKNAHVDIYWLWIYRMLAKLRIRAGIQLTLCGHIVTSGLFAIMGRKQSEQREALQALWTNRAVQCQWEKCPPSPRRKAPKNLAHCKRTSGTFHLYKRQNYFFFSATIASKLSSFSLLPQNAWRYGACGVGQLVNIKKKRVLLFLN